MKTMNQKETKTMKHETHTYVPSYHCPDCGQDWFGQCMLHLCPVTGTYDYGESLEGCYRCLEGHDHENHREEEPEP